MSGPDPAVEVVYALPQRQRVVSVPLREGMTAEQAVEASAILAEFPELAAQPRLLGIYGRRVEGTERLRDGDRVEIYRPLKFDPRDSRRRAAQAARPVKRGQA
jgi:putative ubiquitin-RnfH superfamily antitoxin RatB of RatAB toxin-antitoxin module